MADSPHGGRRPGAGRKPRSTPKTKPIWCGEMTPEERATIIRNTTPDQRRAALLRLARGQKPDDQFSNWHTRIETGDTEMATKPTLEQIVNNRNLWNQYVDPDNAEPKAFNQPLHDRIKTVCDLWPDELTAEDRKYANTNGVNVRSLAGQVKNSDSGKIHGADALRMYRASQSK